MNTCHGDFPFLRLDKRTLAVGLGTPIFLEHDRERSRLVLGALQIQSEAANMQIPSGDDMMYMVQATIAAAAAFVLILSHRARKLVELVGNS